MRRSETINEIATALSKAQGLIRNASKDATNPHFKSKYADLASVVDAYREPFATNGLALTQHPSADGVAVMVTTLLMHTSGQWLESDLTITAQQHTPQAIGSAITYGRRYSAMSVAGIAPDDDDGEQAEARGQAPATPQRAKPAPRAQAKKADDIPFGGPPATIGDSTIYRETDEQKKTMREIFQRMRVLNAEDCQAISAACKEAEVEMHLLGAAVKDWLTQRERGELPK